MKASFKRILVLIALVFVSVSVSGQKISEAIRFTLDHPDGQYAAGETVKLTAQQVIPYNIPLDMTIYVNGIESETRSIGILDKDGVIYTDCRNISTAVVLTFRPSGYSDKEDFLSIGYIVAPEGFKPGLEAPDDLHKYWNKEVRKMRRSPMQVNIKPVELNQEKYAGYECFEIELSMHEGWPVRGYIARPKDAPKKSLPAILMLHAAGVVGGWCYAKPSAALSYAKRGKGAIVVDINAHGMLNDQPESYYQELQDGVLKNYSWRPFVSREDFYFRLMFLRAVRAIDYIAKEPSWDGKNLLVTGESQGGYQSAALCGIDKRVTDAVMFVPAGIDIGGDMMSRLPGWPKPLAQNGYSMDSIKGLAYFDGAALLKGSKANICVEIGLIDVTCPPAAIFAGINQTAGRRTVVTFPYRPHHLARVPSMYMKNWHEDVEIVRTRYFDEYLNR